MPHTAELTQPTARQYTARQQQQQRRRQWSATCPVAQHGYKPVTSTGCHSHAGDDCAAYCKLHFLLESLQPLVLNTESLLTRNLD